LIFIISVPVYCMLRSNNGLKNFSQINEFFKPSEATL
jgi:hypothetical protein